MIKQLFRTLTAALVVSVSIASCVTIQQSPVTGNKRIYGYSWEKEIEIGKQADSEIIAQYGLYEDEELGSYVSDLGQDLLQVSHMRRDDTDSQFKNTEFTFRLLDSPVVNAFALPGGFVYVTRGLMAHLENEAQLAVVLGHEIGHVAARHASQRAAEQQFGQIAVIGGAILGQSFGLDGGNILQLSSQTAQLLFLRYGRDDERESDRLGVEYAAMKHYEAAEGAKFFTSLKRISEKAGVNIPSHLSTHPDPGEREQTIPRLAAQWSDRGYDQTIVNQKEYHELLQGLMYGDNPREGFAENGYFYHPELEFQFPVPGEFEVINQRSAVILVNEARDAIVQMRLDSESADPQASVNQITGQEGIEIVDQGAVNVNGLDAYSATADVSQEGGATLRVKISALRFGGNLYRFLSYTEISQYDEYLNEFNAIFTGFDQLTDQNILNIEPVRLEIVTVQNADTFENLLPDILPMDIDPQDIAIINQVNLTDRIEAGSMIKVPVQN
ncbi:M48 family metalloprotease [Balneola sp. MJW-20]|uniref:M48 family metalloprotease n=1 Tax=Gracilimonas aurantiaca TaxID=3234185 RepID=UPI003466CF31